MDPDGLFFNTIGVASKNEKKLAIDGVGEVASR